MKVAVASGLLAIAFLMSALLQGQTAPSLENGFKSYGSYDGSNIDTINLLNGNQMLHVPLMPGYAQRGGVGAVQYFLYQTSKTWQLSCQVSASNSVSCNWTTNWSGVMLAQNPALSLQRTLTKNGTGTGQISFMAWGYTLTDQSGATHQFYSTPGNYDSTGEPLTFDSVDTSGYHMTTSNPDDYGVMTTVTITDRHGSQYVANFPSSLGCGMMGSNHLPSLVFNGGSINPLIDDAPMGDQNCPQATAAVQVTDANGNRVTMNPPLPNSSANTGIATDTLGRTSFSLLGTLTSDYSGCVSNHTIISATVISYAAPDGTTRPMKFCQATIPIQTGFNAAAAESTSGIAQVVSILLADGSSWTFDYDVYGEVNYVRLPTGGTLSYTWTTISFPACSQWSPYGGDLSRAVVTRTINDNNGHSYTWHYNWGTVANSTITNTVTDPLGNDAVHVFTALNGVNLGGCAFYETQTQLYQGTGSSRSLLKQVDTTYSSANLLTEGGIGNALGNAVPTSIQTTIYPSGKASLVTKQYDLGLGANAPIFGNVTVEKEYDWGSPGTPGPLLRETDTTYQWQVNGSYLTAHLVDLPATVTVKDGSGCALSETDYTYDEAAYLTASSITTQHGAPPGPVRGNLSTVTKWVAPATSCNPKGGTAVITHTNWYDTGEVYQQIDAMGRTTQHTYDPAYAGAYSTQTCSPRTNNGSTAHCVSGTYDFNTGVLTSLTNENATQQASGNTPGDAAHTSNYTYDLMWRLVSAQAPPDPGNGNARATHGFAYSTPNVFPLTLTGTKSITTTQNDSSTATFDGFGRPIKIQHPLPNGTTEIDTAYDALGHVVSVTNPYFSTSDPTYGTVQTAYDALGRATQITEQDRSVKTVSYSQGGCGSGDDTTTTDEAGKVRRTCADALGRLIEVDEPQASAGSSLVNGYTTVYAYDGLSNLLRVDQKGSAPSDSTQWRTRQFTYDTLGRLLTAQNPESGTITYTYDPNSNVATKTDARGIQTTYGYDELNRVTSKTYSDGTPAASYGYDAGCCGVNPQNGVGHMTYAFAGNTELVYVYDVMGRVTTQADCPPSGVARGYCYVLTAAYDLAGDVISLGYPDWTTITYTPDSAGRMVSAVDNGHGVNYVTSASYGPDSALTGFVSGNLGSFAGITNSFTYNQRLQPMNMSAASPSQTVFSIGYDFHLANGDNGTVFGITNYRDSTRSQSFAYDSLNRLTSAQNAGTDCAPTTVNGKTEYWGNSYSYDAWGNLTDKTKTKCGAEDIHFNLDSQNRVHVPAGADYAYDAAGNMTYNANAAQSYSYDGESRILHVDSGVASYTYNSLSDRVRKDVSGGASTEYFYFNGQIVAELNPATGAFTNYVYFAGDRVARRDGTTGPVSYYFSDHLKTASVVTDASGNIKEDEDYYPWGGELQLVNNDSNHYKFTGKERDAETGLDDFGARYYSNGLGRWISADWSATPEPVPYADLEDPQSLNLYGYVRNLPTTNADIDGHQNAPTAPVVTDEAVKEMLKAVGKRIAMRAAIGAVLKVGSATVVGAAIVFGIANIKPPVVGQSNADEIAERDRLDAENAQKLGQARGADEERSLSDDAKDKARTNGGLVKPPRGKGSVPKDKRDPKRTATDKDKAKMSADQNGTCAHCGEPLGDEKGIGHHDPVRHADGGSKMKLVHKKCHNDLHSCN